MVLETSEAERRNNDLILNELQNIRDDIKELRKDVKHINRNCSNRAVGCGKNFVPITTFWRAVNIMVIALLGSYTYTSGVLAYTIKFLGSHIQ